MERRGFFGRILGGIAAAVTIRPEPSAFNLPLKANIFCEGPALTERMFVDALASVPPTGIRGLVDDGDFYATVYGLPRTRKES